MAKWQGDPAGTDAEFQGGTTCGEIGQKADGGVMTAGSKMSRARS
jgi:hypothetical protein